MRSNSNGRTAVKDDTHSCGLSKRQVYGWVDSSQMGEYELISKRDLEVDHEYQRTNVNKQRVLHIARNWSWPAFGTIGVFRRPDGSYLIFDGQHRWNASLKRDDINMLPCLVFTSRAVSEEAKAFGDINTVRGPMKAVEAFKARLVAEDPDALYIQAILEEWDYRVAPNAGPGRVSCISAIEGVYKRSSDTCRRVLSVVASMCDGDAFSGNLFRALAHIDLHLQKHDAGTITRSDIVDKLTLLGSSQCEDAARKYQALAGKGGERVWAAGIVTAINKGKRGKKIPSVFGD